MQTEIDTSELEKAFAEDEAILTREQTLFEVLLSEGKLDRYRGHHIAMLNGEIIASADTITDVAKTAYNSMGYRALLLKYVPKKEENHSSIKDYIECFV